MKSRPVSALYQERKALRMEHNGTSPSAMAGTAPTGFTRLRRSFGYTAGILETLSRSASRIEWPDLNNTFARANLAFKGGV